MNESASARAKERAAWRVSAKDSEQGVYKSEERSSSEGEREGGGKGKEMRGSRNANNREHRRQERGVRGSTGQGDGGDREQQGTTSSLRIRCRRRRK